MFGEHRPPAEFENSRKRPDLLFLPDSTLSAVCTADDDFTTGSSKLRTVLLIELKRRRCKIGRIEIDQAIGYIEKLLRCGLLDGRPKSWRYYVVGHSFSQELSRGALITVIDEARIQALTFSQLVRTANTSLFELRNRVKERYPETGHALLDHLRKQPEQMGLIGLSQASLATQPEGAESGDSKGPGQSDQGGEDSE